MCHHKKPSAHTSERIPSQEPLSDFADVHMPIARGPSWTAPSQAILTLDNEETTMTLMVATMVAIIMVVMVVVVLMPTVKRVMGAIVMVMAVIMP